MQWSFFACIGTAYSYKINSGNWHYWLHDNITASMPFPTSVKYKPTSEMTADVLTKPLQGEQFRKLRNAILNCDTLTSVKET